MKKIVGMATYSTNVVPPRMLVADDLFPPDSPSDSFDKNTLMYIEFFYNF